MNPKIQHPEVGHQVYSISGQRSISLSISQVKKEFGSLTQMLHSIYFKYVNNAIAPRIVVVLNTPSNMPKIDIRTGA